MFRTTVLVWYGFQFLRKKSCPMFSCFSWSNKTIQAVVEGWSLAGIVSIWFDWICDPSMLGKSSQNILMVIYHNTQVKYHLEHIQIQLQKNKCFPFRQFRRKVPSRELTYPSKMAYLKMIFLFHRWDMLISWRVSSIFPHLGFLWSWFTSSGWIKGPSKQQKVQQIFLGGKILPQTKMVLVEKNGKNGGKIW